MSTTFLISDTHFGHLGVCKFTEPDGVTKIRPWTCPNEMDEDLIKNWNSVVSPKDKVYHLGDVVINRKALPTVARLNGDKVLIKGNHDIFKLEDYMLYFRDIRAYHKMDVAILSHIPVHTANLYRFKTNIHGHLHTNKVLLENGVPDPRYINVSVEQINFTPIAWDVIRAGL
jgi:calcineurin-like phosphoesterase family protein